MADFRQQLVDAYQSGDINAFNAVLGQVAQPSAAPAAAPPQAASADPAQMFFDPNEGKAPQQQAPAATPGFFDPNAGQPGSTPAEAPPLQVPGAEGASDAFANSFTDTASFGLVPAAADAVAAFILGKPYSEVRHAANAQEERVAAEHPYASGAGTVAGVFGGGAAAGGVGRAAVRGAEALGVRVPAALIPGAGSSRVANAAKEAAVAGGLAATESAVKGGEPTNVALAGLTGAVLGPAVGLAAGKVAGATAAPLTKAWRYIAKKLDIDPATLSRALAEHEAATGQKMSVAQVLNARQQGSLRQFAEANPEAGEILQAAGREAERALPGQMARITQQATGRPTRPDYLKSVRPSNLSPNSLAVAKKAAADRDFAALRKEPVTLPEGLRDDRNLIDALQGYKMRDLRQRLHDDTLTLGDVDIIRQQLNKVSPHPGSVFSDLRDTLSDEAADQIPAYADALAKFGAASRYEQGFAHGYAGRTKAVADDPTLVRALETPEGMAGLRAGQATHVRNQAAESPSGARKVAAEVSGGAAPAQRARAAVGGRAKANRLEAAGASMTQTTNALRNATPAGLRNAEDESTDALGHIAFGAAQTASGMTHSGGFRILHGLQNLIRSGRVSAEVGERIMRGLTSNDPAIRREAEEALRNAVEQNNALRRFSIGAAAAGGSEIGNTVFTPTQ